MTIRDAIRSQSKTARRVKVPRHVNRDTMVDIDTAGTAASGGVAALRHKIDRTLTTSVHVAAPGPGALTRLRHLNLQQVAALEVSGQPVRLTNAFSHPGAAFVFTLVSGSCTLSCDAGDVQLREGSFVVLRGDRTVTAQHDAPHVVRGTRIPAAQLQRELGDWQRAELVPVDGSSGAGALVWSLQDQLLTCGNALGSRSADAFVELLACVLADALRGVLLSAADTLNSQAEHHRRRIRAHVQEHLADDGLDVADIAAAVGLSPGHVHRLFLGEPVSLRAWIQAERLDACYATLQDTAQAPRSVTDVAVAWGFRSASHFSRSFKQRFGQSPRDVRRLALERQATGTIS